MTSEQELFNDNWKILLANTKRHTGPGTSSAGWPVAPEQKGRYVSYRLSDERVAQLLNLANELLADVARGVYECTRHSNLDRGVRGAVE